MSVTLRSRRDGKDAVPRRFYFVDKTVKLPDGTVCRIREVPADQTKRGAEQFEQDRVREIIDAWRAGGWASRTSPRPRARPCVSSTPASWRTT